MTSNSIKEPTKEQDLKGDSDQDSCKTRVSWEDLHYVSYDSVSHHSSDINNTPVHFFSSSPCSENLFIFDDEYADVSIENAFSLSFESCKSPSIPNHKSNFFFWICITGMTAFGTFVWMKYGYEYNRIQKLNRE